MRGILGILIILGSCGLSAYLDLGLGIQQVIIYYTMGVLGGAFGVMVILSE